MKVLITGGKGFIASNLDKLMSKNEYIVNAPSHRELDVTDTKSVQDYVNFNPPDVIIHTAICGGVRIYQDTYKNFLDNIKMFENIMSCNLDIPIIILGSGAEFNKQNDINNIKEESIFDCWPVDFYGMAKNQITRRSLHSLKKPYILRLFGCISKDDRDFRFIKHSILNLKQGLPIEIFKNKEMDFFYIEDIFTVIDHILKHKGPNHINLVYPEKVDLLNVASLIHKYTKIYGPSIKLNSNEKDNYYTGNGELLKSMNIPLVGLEEGIKRTCDDLLLL